MASAHTFVTMVAGHAGLGWSCRRMPRNGDGDVAAKRTRARRELERQLTADLEATRRLYDIGTFCARSGGDFHECLPQILDAAIAITGADKGNIQLVDPVSDALH